MTSAAPRLAAAGAVALAGVPLAMALANRSAPLVVGLAALLFAGSAVAEGGGVALRDVSRSLRTPPGLAALAFLAWCALSLAWSPFPALSLRTAAEFAPTLLAAFLLARLAPGRLPGWAPSLAAGLLTLGCLAVLASLALDMAPQRLLGQRDALFVFNRPVLTFMLIAGPLAWLLAAREAGVGAGSGRRVAALVLVALVLAAILRSVSGAAALGAASGLTVAALAYLLPKRAGVWLAGTGLSLALVLAPVEGDLLARLMPEALHARLEHSSSRARVAIAQSFGAAVAAEPWRGAGYGTSARFQDAPAARDLEPEMRRMLSVGHPHNSFLQVWAELGAVGASLAGLVLFLTLRGLAAWPKAPFAVALGLVAAAGAVAFVEHGAWQAWWTAGLGTAITWLRASLGVAPLAGSARAAAVQRRTEAT